MQYIVTLTMNPALDKSATIERVVADQWQASLETLRELDPKPDYLVASGSLPRDVPVDFYARVAHLAREVGSRFIVDTSGEELRAAANAGVYLLKPNMRELRQLAQRDIQNESEIQAATAKMLQEQQAEVIVVSLGAAGALLVTGEGTERIPAPTVSIESKIGAGDSMVGGIVLALARGWSLREAARFGVAAGAAAVTTPGTELCRKERTQELYKRMNSEE